MKDQMIIIKNFKIAVGEHSTEHRNLLNMGPYVAAQIPSHTAGPEFSYILEVMGDRKDLGKGVT